MSSLQAEKNALLSNETKYIADNARLTEERAQAHELAARVQVAQGAYKELAQDIRSNFQKELDRLTKDNSSLRLKLDEARQQASDNRILMQKQLDTAQSQVQELNVTKARLETRVLSFESQIESLVKELDSTKSQLSTARRQLEEAVVHMYEPARLVAAPATERPVEPDNALTFRITVLESEKNNLEHRIAELRNDIETYKTIAEQAEAGAHDLQVKVDYVAHEKDMEIERVRQDLEHSRTTCESIQEKNEELARALDTAQTDYDNRIKMIESQTIESNSRIASLSAQV